jgi:hypothetical protein
MNKYNPPKHGTRGVLYMDKAAWYNDNKEGAMPARVRLTKRERIERMMAADVARHKAQLAWDVLRSLDPRSRHDTEREEYRIARMDFRQWSHLAIWLESTATVIRRIA